MFDDCFLCTAWHRGSVWLFTHSQSVTATFHYRKYETQDIISCTFHVGMLANLGYNEILYALCLRVCTGYNLATLSVTIWAPPVSLDGPCSCIKCWRHRIVFAEAEIFSSSFYYHFQSIKGFLHPSLKRWKFAFVPSPPHYCHALESLLSVKLPFRFLTESAVYDTLVPFYFFISWYCIFPPTISEDSF